jgi:putative membrane protein
MRERQRTRQLAGTSNTIHTTLLVLRYLLWGLLILTGLAIISLNADAVSLNYFWKTVSLPLSLLLLCSFTIGWLIGIGLNLISHIKLNAYNRRLQQRCECAEREIMRLKKDFSPDEVKDALSNIFPPNNAGKTPQKIAHYSLIRDI